MAQNKIIKTPIQSLGYNFIESPYLPKGKDEYYLRDLQNRSGIPYRQLTAYEIEVLVRNRNTSDDWNKILVSDAFNPELVKNCKFYGLIRIGKLEPAFLNFSDLKVAVGIYNSTIISCDIGNNVVIDNVNYMSHYITGDDVIIINVNELSTTNHSKFGIGIIKEGEDESKRIWLEICNENGGRRVIPFNGMLPGDAWLWSKYRDDEALLDKFRQFTELEFKTARGFYGKIGDRTVIKNTSIIKDVWIGSDAYIKGANKIKNITINSNSNAPSQIGEGCEIVNGIIGFGCRIFYGVKAVRFVMASHSQLKYGARLINSYLGNNATISCCEVLNSLIFPAHEQHHNNSFLCASLVMGQSNIPAGATIGSNHNSRGADGEIIAGRGFWPGLSVSLKHNSKFASFTIIAKGNYSYELNIPIPFSLVSQDESKNQLTVMPAYWFMYNLYALARNTWKYIDRDRRTDKTQLIEYNYLAPDTVNEMFEAMSILELSVGKAFLNKENKSVQNISEEEYKLTGKQLLGENNPVVDQLEIAAYGFENAKRKTIIIKVRKAYHLFRQMISYYGMFELIQMMEEKNCTSLKDIQSHIPTRLSRKDWLNVGGQLIPKDNIELFRSKVKSNKIKLWEGVHHFYKEEGVKYAQYRLQHALASLNEIEHISLKKIAAEDLDNLLAKTQATRKWLVTEIEASRAKDYTNAFRKMVYDSQEEMDNVVGRLAENSFINAQKQELKAFSKKILSLRKRLIP